MLTIGFEAFFFPLPEPLAGEGFLSFLGVLGEADTVRLPMVIFIEIQMVVFRWKTRLGSKVVKRVLDKR